MKTVGVLGGMGPKATTYFMNLVIDNTNAKSDQDNINMIVMNHSSIPDRTLFLLGKGISPVPYLIKDAIMLENAGCDFLVLTCNTSHFAYDEIVSNISIPLVNMPLEVCNIINSDNRVKKVGLMATLGTIKAGVYSKYLNKEIFIPNDELQREVNSLIYDKVKKNIRVSKEEFMDVLNKFYNEGCDIVITGCTELSVIVKDNELYNEKIIDSMMVLANKTIELANLKELKK